MKYCLILFIGLALMGSMVYVPCNESSCARASDQSVSTKSYQDEAWRVYCRLRLIVRGVVSGGYRFSRNAYKYATSEPAASELQPASDRVLEETEPTTSKDTKELIEGEAKDLKDTVNKQAALIRHGIRHLKGKCKDFVYGFDEEIEETCDCGSKPLKIC